MKNRVAKFWNNYYVYIVSSAIIIAVIMAVLAVKGFWPFGNAILLNGDFGLQSWPYITELKHKLMSGDSLIYTWNAGYGINFYAIATGLINPLTILYLLMSTDKVLQFSSIIFILLELMVNWSMLYYLTHRPYHHLGSNRIANMLFSLSYTLCMYEVSNINNWHLMICAVYFPLIILGLERFVVNKDWKLYYIMLTVSFIGGYYMTALFSIFIILYYLTLEFGSFKVFWKKSIKILGISILSVLSAAIVLVPTYLQLLQNTYTISEYSTNRFFTTFFDTLKNFLIFNLPIDRGTTAQSYGEVNLYYGLFMLMLTSLYFLNSKIKLAVRLKRLGVVVLYLLAFNLNGLNYVMHLFHYPSWFPNRFSINFTLLCIILAYDAWVSMEETEFKYVTVPKVLAVGIGWFATTLLCFAFAETIDYQFTYYYSIMFFMVYMIALLLMPYIRRKYPAVISIIACVELCMGFGFALIFKNAGSEIELSNTYQKIEGFFSNIDVEEQKGFSRIINNSDMASANQTLLFDQKGISVFTSAMPNTGDFLNKVGVFKGTNFLAPYSYNQATYSLLNIQYMYEVKNDGNMMPDSIYSSCDSTYNAYPIIKEGDIGKLYENPTVLSLGYMTNTDVEKVVSDNLEDYTLKDIINIWVNTASGVENVMEEGGLRLEGVEASNCQIFCENNIFIISKDIESDDLFMVNVDEIRKNGFVDTHMDKYDAGENSQVCFSYIAEQAGEYLIQIGSWTTSTGYLNIGENVDVCCVIDEDTMSHYNSLSNDIHVFRLNEEQWEKAYDVLSKQQMQVEGYSSTTVDGTIDVKEDGLLFTSIPYDVGWHAYVDGNEVDTIGLWNNTFVALQLEPGEHSIHFEYKQRGLLLGGILSIVAVVGLVGYAIWEKKTGKHLLLESKEQFGQMVDDFYSEEQMAEKEKKKRKHKNKQDLEESVRIVEEEKYSEKEGMSDDKLQ